MWSLRFTGKASAAMAKKDGGITFDDAVYRKKIRDLARRMNVDEAEFVREQAGFLARDFAKYVPPFRTFPTGRGTSMGKKEDQKAGQLAIMADMNRIFFQPDDSAVYDWARKQFPQGQIWTKGRITGAGVAHTLRDMAKHHARFQNPRTGRIGRVSLEQRLWVSRSMFNEYLAQEIRKVGIAKATIAKSAIYLHPKIKAIRFISRHFSYVRSSARMAKIKNSPTAFFRGTAAGLHNLRGKTISIVKRARLKAMEKRLTLILKGNAKKSGFKVR